MQNKNILLITLRGDIGGGTKHVDSIYENLKEEFNLFLASPVEEPYGVKWKNATYKFNHFLNLPKRKFSVRSFFKLILFSKKNKIKIVHAHGWGAGIYARLLKLFIPKLVVLYTLHGFHIESLPIIKRKISFLLERILSILTTMFINVSNSEKLTCLAYHIYKEKKSLLIYNGVADKFSKEFDVKSIRAKLGLPIESFIVISVTRFDSVKNLSDFVEIAYLLKSEADILFVLLGNGEEMEKVKQINAKYQLENLLLTGFIENPFEYLISSNIYLSTSKVEGLPYSLIEANMCGKPVVASNVRGNNEIVVDKINGLLFSLSNLSEAADSILRLKNDHIFYQKLSVNARQRYLSLFTEERMIGQLKNLYERYF